MSTAADTRAGRRRKFMKACRQKEKEAATVAQNGHAGKGTERELGRGSVGRNAIAFLFKESTMQKRKFAAVIAAVGVMAVGMGAVHHYLQPGALDVHAAPAAQPAAALP